MKLFDRGEVYIPTSEEAQETLYPRANRQNVEILPERVPLSPDIVQSLINATGLANGFMEGPLEKQLEPTRSSDELDTGEAHQVSAEEQHAVLLINGLLEIINVNSRFNNKRESRLQIDKFYGGDPITKERAIRYTEMAFSAVGARAYARYGSDCDEIVVTW